MVIYSRIEATGLINIFSRSTAQHESRISNSTVWLMDRKWHQYIRNFCKHNIYILQRQYHLWVWIRRVLVLTLYPIEPYLWTFSSLYMRRLLQKRQTIIRWKPIANFGELVKFGELTKSIRPNVRSHILAFELGFDAIIMSHPIAWPLVTSWTKHRFTMMHKLGIRRTKKTTCYYSLHFNCQTSTCALPQIKLEERNANYK